MAVILGVFCVFSANAGTVRTLLMNDKKMEPVRLALGKSTILRFPSPPKQTIVGNQNYYKIEFINNDVTIQPQAQIPSNLFVYTGTQTYGFLLTVQEQGEYDDFVKVSWKNAKVDVEPLEPDYPDVFLGREMRLSFDKVFKIQTTKEIIVVDMFIQNRTPDGIPSKKITLQAWEGGNKPLQSEVVFDRDIVTRHQRARVRIFVEDTVKKMFSISIQYGKYSAKIFTGQKPL